MYQLRITFFGRSISSPRRGRLGTRQFMVTTWLFAHVHAHRWRPTQRQLLKCLVFYLVISAKSYEDSVIPWTCALRNAVNSHWNYSEYLQQCGDTCVARLKKKRKEERRWTIGSLTNFGLVLPRWLLATVKVFYGTHEFEGQVPIKPYSCCFSRNFCRLPFVLHIIMACPCYPYIQSLPTL